MVYRLMNMEVIKLLLKIILVMIGVVVFACILPLTFPITLYFGIRELLH